MAVGLAFALAADGEGLAGAAALALGIGVQNFPEGAAVALPLYQSGQSKLRAFGPVCSPARWSRCSACWSCWRRRVCMR